MNFSFILYKHGPFSFDLRDVLSAMEAERLITWEPQPYPYGPTMVSGPFSSHVTSKAKMPHDFADQISFVADNLASKKVGDLEKLATALYVTLDRSIASERRAEELTYRKPHITLPAAQLAIQEVDEIINMALSRGMIRKVAAANSSAFQIQR